MGQRWIAVVILFSLMTVSAIAAKQSAQPAKSAGGWTLPPEAETTKNPLPVDAKLLATGKSIFKEKCQKCHGATGKGDGPDADPDAHPGGRMEPASSREAKPSNAQSRRGACGAAWAMRARTGRAIGVARHRSPG